MSGNFLTEAEINRLASSFTDFEHTRFPDGPFKTFEDFVQQIRSDLESIAPFARMAMPTLEAIQREQLMTHTLEEDITLPSFFDSQTYYRSCLAAIQREHTDNEHVLERQRKIIDDLLDNLRFQQDPHGVLRAFMIARGQHNATPITSIVVLDPYEGESKIESYLRVKNIEPTEVEALSDLPRDFIDPITFSIMLKPVKDALGLSYDFNAIRRWFEQTATVDSKAQTPLTNEQLPHLRLEKNTQLEEELLQYLVAKFGPEQKRLKFEPGV